MKFRFLTLQQVLILHKISIEEFGGIQGVRDYGLLESSLHAPQNTNLYFTEDIFFIAAVYMHTMIKNHAFIDGNKRIGVLSALSFFELNQIKTLYESEDIFMCALAVAESKYTVDDVAIFLKTKNKLTDLSISDYA